MQHTVTWVLLITQLLSTVILAVPPAYRRTGPVAPSAFLALAVLLEVVAFGDLSDATTALGMLCFASASALLAVFRHDSQQRDAALQVPVDGILLRIEEHVRKFCTFTSTGILCPPMAVLCIYSALCNPFWRARPALVEYLRARRTRVARLVWRVGLWPSAKFPLLLRFQNRLIPEIFGI